MIPKKFLLDNKTPKHPVKTLEQKPTFFPSFLQSSSFLSVKKLIEKEILSTPLSTLQVFYYLLKNFNQSIRQIKTKNNARIQIDKIQ
jgi:hypothetical protein